jgi:2'-hydroxyisoflavone reductase
MRLLVLGGTVFLGRHAVEAALSRGHEVTLFNRGRHNPALFPGVEKIRGDRDGDLAALDGRRWDAVLDTSGHAPHAVRASAERLAGAVGRYIFVSTVAVYRDFPAVAGLDESRPVCSGQCPADEQIGPRAVGPLKALCERAAEACLPGRVLCVRAGLLVGPFDPTGRFTYWPRRIARGGEVLVPGTPDVPVQLIDARDVAAWIIRMAEAGETGTYNATGPDYPLTMRRLVEACRAASGSDARFTHVREDFLVSEGVTRVAPWVAGAPGAGRVSCEKAIAAGLTFRPLSATARDTLGWDTAEGPSAAGAAQAGLTREREAALLRACHRRPQLVAR